MAIPNMNTLAQLNVRLKSQDALRVRLDAKKIGVNLEDYAAKAFEAFLDKSAKARREFFQAPDGTIRRAERKLMGRKVKLSA